MDYGERSGTGINVVLLDWEKTFDKITHQGLHDALERMDIPANFKNLIKELYKILNSKLKSTATAQNGKNNTQELDKGAPYHPTFP